jgi:hypothetical protein
VFLVPLVVARELQPVYTVPILPPTLHDGLDHANWFRLIYETRSVSPSEVLAPPLAPDGSPTYYPWGLHAWLALLAQTTTLDPMTVFIRSLVAVSAALPLSIFVFVAHFTGNGWPAVSAAAFSLMFWWMPYQIWGWGGYALLAGAVAALPVTRLSLVAVVSRSGAGLAAAAACGLGVLFVHPSQALGALFIAAIAAAALAAGRLAPWWSPAPFLIAIGVAGAAMVVGETASAPIADFLERARDVGDKMSRDPRFAWPYGLYFNGEMGFPMRGRIGLGVFYVAGAIFAAFHASTRPFLALHVVLGLLVPLTLHQTWLTALWYHTPERVWYLQCASLPALGGLGIAAILLALRRAGAAWSASPPWQAVLWPVVLVLFLGGLNAAYYRWVTRRLTVLAVRGLSFTDHRVLADFRWIRDNVPAGEVIFNATADWGLSLPFTGRRTVFWSGGYAVDPSTSWSRFLDELRLPEPSVSQGAVELRRRGIRYIYAATWDPSRRPVGALMHDGATLSGTVALDRAYESPTALIFRIRDDESRSLGLEDSEDVQFSGFHDLERAGGQAWRWTDGHGRLRLPTARLKGRDCFLRILGPRPDSYKLQLGGQDLELAAMGFALPREALLQDAIELTIRSPAVVPHEVDGSGDTRRLGVQVNDISLLCWSS